LKKQEEGLPGGNKTHEKSEKIQKLPARSRDGPYGNKNTLREIRAKTGK
jgi:hypothetical protein